MNEDIKKRKLDFLDFIGGVDNNNSSINKSIGKDSFIKDIEEESRLEETSNEETKEIIKISKEKNYINDNTEKSRKIILNISKKDKAISNKNYNNSRLDNRGKNSSITEEREKFLNISKTKETSQSDSKESKKPIIDPIKDLKNKGKENKEQVDVEKMFVESDTDYEEKEKWIDTYNKATKSKSKSYIIEKCSRGKFRIRDGKIEILPEMDIKSKSSKDLMSVRWDI